MLAVTGSDGEEIGRIPTSASNRMRWAVGWHDDSTIVLYSSDIGVTAWKIGDDGQLVEVPQPLSENVKATGERIRTGG